jgi:hypothetical protein
MRNAGPLRSRAQKSMDTTYILFRYNILISARFNNEKRQVPLNDAQILDYDLQAAKIFEDILKRKTGQIIVEGIHSSGWAPVVMPYWRHTCNASTVSRDKMEPDVWNVLVGFTPDTSCFVDSKTKDFKPGGSPAEGLFHELVHAFRFVNEKASNRKGPSIPSTSLKKYPEYDTEEDFFAVLITNIFSSETGRPLRAGHDNNEALPSHLATSIGFLAVEDYARLVRQFCSDHKPVSAQLAAVPSDFNPITEYLHPSL